jgi:hypothetical protein
MSIYDFPLDNFPSLIATLIRQRTLKIVKRELEAKGVELGQVPACYIRLLAEGYFESHRAECARVACDTVRMAAGLYELAQKEAHQRAMVGGVLSLAKGSDYHAIESH